MAYKVTLDTRPEVAKEIHSRLVTYYRILRNTREAINVSDDASEVLKIPAQNAAFQLFISGVQAKYTNAEIKAILDDVLPTAISMADVGNFVSGWASIASAIESNTDKLVLDFDSNHSPRLKYSTQAAKSALITIIDATLAHCTE